MHEHKYMISLQVSVFDLTQLLQTTIHNLFQ